MDDKIDLSAVEGEEAVVGDTTLCWYPPRYGMIRAYDLILKRSFISPIKGLDRSGNCHAGVMR